MKTLSIIFIFLIVLFISSCDENTTDPIDDEVLQDTISTEYSISGLVQKGPYINGTSITINELKLDLNQTGKSFSAQILDNRGLFELNKIIFSSPFVELKANGFYFNEVSNEVSTAQLTLYALSNITDKSTLNVNLLSYLEKGRIQYLVANGYDFFTAKDQAQKEILAIFSIDKSNILQSELLDITAEGDDNAILLAVSVILQGYLSISELSELIANISTDIREDGVLDSETLKSQLINTALKLNVDEIRNNIESRYETMGTPIKVADFEKFITYFIEETDFISNEKIEYPIDGAYGLNILNDENIYCPEGGYSMKANLPEGFTLKVKITGDNFGYVYGQDNPGWVQESYEANTYTSTYVSTRTGDIDLKMFSILNDQSAPITIKIFENDATEPTRIKTITYGNGTGFFIPEIGAYGENVFAFTDSTFVDTSKTYSLTINLNDDKTYDVEIKMHFDEENSYVIDETKIENWEYYATEFQLRLILQGQNKNADMPIKFIGNGYLSIEGGVQIHGIRW